jgi:uncharacterized protein (TIGR02147 family)
MNTAKTYRALLREELEKRCERNPRYSLRSFARDLGLAPARLSDVLRGRYGISRVAAETLAKKLGWNAEERAYFSDLVESEHARSKIRRESAAERLQSLSQTYQQLSVDGYQVVADWYHYAILELTITKTFQSDLAWIAKTLGISEHIVTAAVERLKRLELLEDKNGKLVPTDAFTASPDGIPSESIKKNHQQILEKAITAIREQTVEERDFSNMVLAVSKQDLPRAKEMIKRFRREFDAEFGKAATKDEVYCLGVQFFRLQEKS